MIGFGRAGRSHLIGFALLAALCIAGAAPAADAPARAGAFRQDVAWSPDGQHLAYSEYTPGEGGARGPWSIWTVNLDGSGARLIVNDAEYVDWSPDGARLVFCSDRGANWDIYTSRADGSELRRLTTHAARDRQPAWSPLGDRIAFISDRDGPAQVYLMAPDGSRVTRLTRANGDSAKAYNPAWSSDGRGIVFDRDRGDHKDQVHVVMADGSREWQVTNDAANNIFPGFLPDGRVGFSSSSGGSPQLVHVRMDGSDRRIVPDVAAFFARWSPDGKRIATVAGEWPNSSIVVMSADGSGARTIIGAPAVEPAAPDSNLFVSAAAGVGVRKPSSWRFMSRNDVIENRQRIRLKDSDWDSLMQKQAALPLVAIAKYAEVHESINPTCSITVRTLSPFGGMTPTEMLKITTDQLAKVFKGYEIAAPVESTRVSGLPAAKMRLRYTLDVPEHGTYRVLSRLWMVPRPPLLFLIGQGGPTEGPDLSEEEFESILRTVRIDP